MPPVDRPTTLRSQRKRSAWDWILNATLLGAVLIAAGVFLLAVTVTLLGYLVPLPTAALHQAVRTAAILIGLACAVALLLAGRLIRRDAQASYRAAGLEPAEHIPVAELLAPALRRLTGPLEPEGGLTGRRRRTPSIAEYDARGQLRSRRRTSTSRPISWPPAAAGMASSAPTSPSMAPPTITETMVSTGEMSTLRRMMRGVIR